MTGGPSYAEAPEEIQFLMDDGGDEVWGYHVAKDDEGMLNDSQQ